MDYLTDFTASVLRVESDYIPAINWIAGQGVNSEALEQTSRVMFPDLDYGGEGLMWKRDLRFLHACIGLTTESGELLELFSSRNAFKPNFDVVNLTEELGDLCWYIGVAADAMDEKLESLVEAAEDNLMEGGYLDSTLLGIPSVDYIGRLVVESSQLMDTVKRFLFYGKELPRSKVEAHIVNILSTIMILAMQYGTTLQNIMAANQAKLKARYPGKFSATDAVNRDLEKERAALTGTQ